MYTSATDTFNFNKGIVANLKGTTVEAQYVTATSQVTAPTLVASTAVYSSTLTNYSGNLVLQPASGFAVINDGVVTSTILTDARLAAYTGLISAGNVNVTGTTTTAALSATNVTASGNVAVTGNETVGGTLAVTGATTLAALSATNVTASGTLGVTGATTLASLTAGASTLASASITGNETVGGNVAVTGNETIGGTLAVTGASTLASASVTGNETVGGTLGVTGATTLAGLTATNVSALGTLSAAGNATLSADLAVTGNETVGGTLGVTGATTLAGLTAGASTLASAAIVNNATVGGTLAVTGATTAAAISATNVTASGNVAVTGASTLHAVSATDVTASGTLAVTGAVTGSSATFSGNVVAANFSTTGDASLQNFFATGASTIGGTLDVTGGVTLESTLSVSGAVSLTSSLNVANGVTVNSNQTANDFVVEGTTATSLILADSSMNSLVFGGSATAGVAGVIAKFNSNSTIMLPVGDIAQRPSNSGSTDLAGMVRFSTTSNNLEFYNGSSWQQTGSSFTIITSNSFIGDGATTEFTMSTESTTAGTMVAINGVMQLPTLAYSVSGVTLTFTEAPSVGDLIDARVLITTASVSTMSNGNGYVQVKANDTGVVLYAGTGGSTPRLSIDATTGTATFANDVVITGNLTVHGDSTGTINIGDSSADTVNVDAGILNYTGTKLAFDQTAVAVGTSATVIDSFAKATYRSAKYIVTISNSGTGEYETTEVLVLHNGTTAQRTQFGTMHTGSASLGSVSVAVNGANVELSYTGVATGNAVKLQTSYIKV